MAPTSDPPEIKTIQSSDYESLAEILKDFRNKRSPQYWLERFHFWWEDNPFYNEGMARGWILVHQGEIVSFLGAIPYPVQIDGQTVSTFCSTSWYVHPDYRKFGLLTLFQMVKESSDTIFWATTTNALSGKVIKLLKFKPIPRHFNRRFLVFICGLAQLRYQRGTSDDHQESWLDRLLARIHWRTNALCTLSLQGSGPLHVRRLSTAGEEFDQLWQRTRSRYRSTRERSARYINWYCFAWNRPPRYLFGCYNGEKLVGFAIFIPRMVEDFDFLECFDLWLEDENDDRAGAALFSFALRLAAKEEKFGLISFDYPGVAGWLAAYRRSQSQEVDPGGWFRCSKTMEEKITGHSHYFVLAEGDQRM
jgi:hypothetical protein